MFNFQIRQGSSFLYLHSKQKDKNVMFLLWQFNVSHMTFALLKCSTRLFLCQTALIVIPKYILLFTTFDSLPVAVLPRMNESGICYMQGCSLVIILESQSKAWLCNHLGTHMSWSEKKTTTSKQKKTHSKLSQNLWKKNKVSSLGPRGRIRAVNYWAYAPHVCLNRDSSHLNTVSTS